MSDHTLVIPGMSVKIIKIDNGFHEATMGAFTAIGPTDMGALNNLMDDLITSGYIAVYSTPTPEELENIHRMLQ